jgi:hypothetical protein
MSISTPSLDISKENQKHSWSVGVKCTLLYICSIWYIVRRMPL